MKNKWFLMFCLSLALVGLLFLPLAVSAQSQGGGRGVCPAGQASQVCTGGPGGTCVVNPSQTTGQQTCPIPEKAKKRQGKGYQGGGQSGQSATPANPPAAGK